jgi:lactate permease
MMLPELSFFNVLLAALPILLVLYLMIGRNWRGHQAGPAGLAAAAVIALVAFGGDLQLLLVAWGRSLLLALFVLYIIWMALLFYHVTDEAGIIDVLQRTMPAFAPDRPAQALLLAWIFASFIQGASGFGVPAAIVAPLLVGLGFSANRAVVMALVGHAWAVTFGSLGSSFLALMAATGLPGETLAGPAAIYLGVGCLLCGFLVLWFAGGLEALRRQWLALVLLGVLMAAVQWGIAVAGLWNLAAFGAGMVGLVAGIFFFRAARRRQPATDQPPGNLATLARTFLPYGLLVVIIVLGQIVLDKPLSAVEINWRFPEVETRFGWITEAGPGRSVSVFGHAGALLLYTSILTYLWYRWRGTIHGGAIEAGAIVRRTVKGSTKSTLAIVTLVAMAVTMQHAGMTEMLAVTLSNTGAAFPFLSPFIGALGAFMTGSNTNSNVVFGQIQQQTAVALQLSVPVILVAQTAGGAIGSLFAPAKVVVGCSTVSGADDSRVLKYATASGLAIIAVLGLITLVL